MENKKRPSGKRETKRGSGSDDEGSGERRGRVTTGKGDKRLTGERRPRVIREDQKTQPERSFRRESDDRERGPREERPSRPERKPYGSDRSDKPKRTYDKPKRRSDDLERGSRGERSPRPERKPYGSDRSDKPKRTYDKPERRSDDHERSPREERPSRPERKPYGSDRSDKPQRSYDKPERRSDERERSPREERPSRPERKPYGSDRLDKPKRTYDKPERPYKEESRNRAPGSKPFKRDKGEYEEHRSYQHRRTENRGKPSRKERPDDDGTIRLNKYIANSGVCSRREADKLIEAGAVTVNGVVVTELGTKVAPTDKIRYGDQTLSREKPRYVLLNKPKGFITTTDDPEDRKTVMNLVAKACKERIYPVGRLDRNTTGLLLFTNDGEMAKKLAHPRYGIKKIYHVVLDRNLTKADLTKIADGFTLDDGPVKVDAIEYIADANDKKEIGIELHSGKNRVVRRIFESLDYKVVRLDRVVFAGLTKKNLPRGEWRFLEEKEINMLKIIS